MQNSVLSAELELMLALADALAFRALLRLNSDTPRIQKFAPAAAMIARQPLPLQLRLAAT